LSKRISAALSDGLEVGLDTLRALEMFEFEQPLARGRRQLLDGSDGVRLSTYAAAAPGKPPVVLVLPCGMPFQLCQPWFDTLCEDYSVFTWETRGLFGEVADFDCAGLGVDSQLADLFRLLDHHRISGIHVMGLCGGAVIAMRAVEKQPERFRSMSLWYGDYHLGDSSLRTAHQKNFDWLMSEAGQDRAQARELHQMFLDPSILSTVPDEIAHWALYPYASPELLYRYAKLNAFLNEEDVTASLPDLAVSTLVVAGDRDTTTHSGASEFVAAHLPVAHFEMESHGDHQKFFGAPAASRALALRFIAEQFA
jgi:pimeloyl-ACP methyl ester carboxylesterase